MTILEPLTLATDYLLAIASIVFGTLLWKRGNRAWALAFVFTACGSFFGGTFHGFGGETWWKLTVYSIGAASLFLLMPFLRVAAIAMFVIYAAWMTVHDSFIYVIVDYGLTLLLLAIIMIIRPSAMSRWVLASVGVSVVAAIVQQAPIPFHNDVYHVIQLIALWLLYRGGTLMTSSTVRPTTQPT
jgi:Family of unknown function (DUF6962)